MMRSGVSIYIPVQDIYMEIKNRHLDTWDCLSEKVFIQGNWGVISTCLVPLKVISKNPEGHQEMKTLRCHRMKPRGWGFRLRQSLWWGKESIPHVIAKGEKTEILLHTRTLSLTAIQHVHFAFLDLYLDNPRISDFDGEKNFRTNKYETQLVVYCEKHSGKE